MKLDVSQPVLTHTGEPFKAGGDTDWNLGRWMLVAINRPVAAQGEGLPPVEDTLMKAEIGFKVESALANGGQCDLTSEERAFFKRLAPKNLFDQPVLVDQMMRLVEGKEQRVIKRKED